MSNDGAAEDGRTSTFPGDEERRTRPRHARICIVHPRELSSDIDVRVDRLELGRDAGPNRVSVPHGSVSRSHLEILREHGDVWSCIDCGSRNGSWVGGLPLSEVPRALAHGDVLRMGGVLAVFELNDRDGPERSAGAVEAVPGRSAAARTLREGIARAAVDRSPVLVVGESGTGKESVVRELHRGSGRAGPLVVANCAALSASLVESQLFGHVRGAFTGADSAQPGLFRSADGGTLFLDEIGDLPLALQPKLLRAIERGEVTPLGGSTTFEVDTRILAATNKDLRVEVEAGRFRRDLYARLSLVELRMPPIRERRADIVEWIDRLHERWRTARGLESDSPLRFTAQAVEALLLHAWPENLRGIDRLVHALGSRDPTGEVARPDLPVEIVGEAEGVAPDRADAPVVSAAARPPRPERDELVAALTELGWSIRAVARRFGRSRRQVSRWIADFGIEDPR